MIIANEKELNNISEQLNKFNFDIVPKSHLDKVKELYKLQNNDLTVCGIKVTISKNQIKKINSLKSEINNDSTLNELYKKYNDYCEIKSKYGEHKKNIDEWESHSERTLNNITRFLKRTGFITEDNLIF